MMACMGGWCTLRDKCPHNSAPAGDEPKERMCLAGRDGVRAIWAGPFRVILIDVLSGRELQGVAA